jgi:hypothetical protein
VRRTTPATCPLIEGEVEVLEIDALPQQRGDRFVARSGFDPRALATPHRWFRILPRRIQAWREVKRAAGPRADERWPVVGLTPLYATPGDGAPADQPALLGEPSFR